MQLNQINDSKSNFQELINTITDWARPVFNLGRVYMKLGKNLEALEYYNKALGMNQEDDEIYYYIGVCYYNI